MCINWLCPVNREICFTFLGDPCGIRIQGCPSKILEQGSSIPLPAKPKAHSQSELHPSGCCCTSASALKFFSDRSCHQWNFKSQSAPHRAFQLSFSFYQLCKSLTSPPSSCAAQLSLSLPDEPLMWILMSQAKGTEVSKDQLFKVLWKIQIILTNLKKQFLQATELANHQKPLAWVEVLWKLHWHLRKMP